MSKVRWPCGCELPVKSCADTPMVINVEFGDTLPKGIELDVYNINLNCEATWDMICSGRTKGVFQLESALGRQWAKKLEPRNIQELGALGALIRPGCLRAMSGNPPKSMTQRYCDRKHGVEEVVYPHESLEPILKNTQGVLTFQEQAMKIAVVLAGFNEQQADILRKAIGKKKADVMLEVKKSFLEGAEKTGIVSQELAEEIFGWIQESQRYSFNKSHADAYALNGYWSAFCKTHMPLEFYCSWLRGAAWKGAKQYEEIYDLVNDAKLNNIDVLPPTLADKRNTFYIKDKKVYFGLSSIRGIGTAVIEKMIDKLADVEKNLGRGIGAWMWMEYLKYGTECVSSNVTEAMIKAGALDFMDRSRNEMLYQYSIWSQLSPTEKKWIVSEYKGNNLLEALKECQPKRVMKNKVQIAGGGCVNDKRSEFVGDLIASLKNPPHKLEDSMDWIAWNEQKTLGAPITCSRVDAVERGIEANCTCKEYITTKRKDYMKFAVEVTKVKVVKTKSGKNPGQEMAFLTVEDNSCSLDDVVCFPDKFQECRDAIYEGNTILIQGDRGRNDSLVIGQIWQI
tara:strand:- start:4729 stop:6429 length:1701 start_codon:yes stop_codon:yes gene_type:complete